MLTSALASSVELLPLHVATRSDLSLYSTLPPTQGVVGLRPPADLSLYAPSASQMDMARGIHTRAEAMIGKIGSWGPVRI